MKVLCAAVILGVALFVGALSLGNSLQASVPADNSLASQIGMLQ